MEKRDRGDLMTKTTTQETQRRGNPLLPMSLSALIHFALLPFLLPLQETAASKLKPAEVHQQPLRLLSGDDTKRLLKKRPQNQPKPKPSKLPNAPVVSLSRLTKEISTKQARFLATVDNQVDRETRSRRSGLQKKLEAQQRKPQPAQQATRSGQRHKSHATRLNRSKRGTYTLTDDQPVNPQARSSIKSLTALDALLYQSSIGNRNSSIANGTPEHIEGVADGNETVLNTKAYKHGWFFNRVVGALYQNWRVQEAHRLHDPSGRVYGVRDRNTVLAVVLDMSGNLVEARILESSGAPHLDDEALATFKRAQPFPNPPSELGDADGRIRFPMGFRLQFGKPSFFRMR